MVVLEEVKDLQRLRVTIHNPWGEGVKPKRDRGHAELHALQEPRLWAVAVPLVLFGGHGTSHPKKDALC